MTAPQSGTDREVCPNGCRLSFYGTHQGPPHCDRLPRDPTWDEPDPERPAAWPRRLASKPSVEAQQDDKP